MKRTGPELTEEATLVCITAGGASVAPNLTLLVVLGCI